MTRWLIAAGVALALVACEQRSPTITADAVPSDAAVYIVNFDETQTTQDAVTKGILSTGAGVVQYDNFEGHWGAQSQLDRFLQAYAVEKVRLEARKQGYQVSEQTLQDGSVKLQIVEGT